MKKLFYLDNEEKNRILEMHKKASKNLYLTEQAASSGNTTTASTQTKTIIPVNQERPKESNISIYRKERIKALLDTSPKYGFKEIKRMLRRENDLDVYISNIQVVTINGEQTARVYGYLEEQSLDTENLQYEGDIIFDFQCSDKRFKLVKSPSQNTTYSGVKTQTTFDGGTDDVVAGTESPSKIKGLRAGDPFESKGLDSWLSNNLYICGRKFQAKVE